MKLIKKKKRVTVSGMSLAELVLTIAIIAVIGAAAVVGINAAVNSSREKTTLIQQSTALNGIGAMLARKPQYSNIGAFISKGKTEQESRKTSVARIFKLLCDLEDDMNVDGSRYQDVSDGYKEAELYETLFIDGWGNQMSYMVSYDDRTPTGGTGDDKELRIWLISGGRDGNIGERTTRDTGETLDDDDVWSLLQVVNSSNEIKDFKSELMKVDWNHIGLEHKQYCRCKRWAYIGENEPPDHELG